MEEGRDDGGADERPAGDPPSVEDRVGPSLLDGGAEAGGQDTLSVELPAGGAPPGGLPALGGERYELLELLGKGGMGVVYRAHDRRLRCAVALKLVSGADPTLAMRLLREARAQARISHPNVCRVFDVGELDGRPYIALQLVDGEPLHRAAAAMSLEAKVAALRDVALGVQEAHRLGIVHRDLKPANIIVERDADGRWIPIVTDFGLAREAAVDPTLTRSGALLGTPPYMAPEQARGELHAIDRRSDVYSLGATLYELLTGRPPFTDPSLARLLAQVIHDDPPPPRGLVPSVPVDLETIALKALAKDPAQRYPSARALADDLDRYLAGEPIVGRRQSLWQRVRRRARRQRALVVLGAWSLVALVVVGWLGARAGLAARAERARAVDRAGLAQQLGQDAKGLELFLRTAYQLPLRDIRPAREQVRERMRAMAATRHDLGPLGDALIHAALGRGHLALHEWRAAADQLAQAAAAGLATPELHAARGRALGELYHRALEDARRSGNPAWPAGNQAWLAGQQRKLAQQYLAPALVELALSGGAGDGAAYLHALIALYRGEPAIAERAAIAAADQAPWLYEARQLAGDAAYAAAMAAFDRGAYDAARSGLERALANYAEASEVARSDAALYEATARAWLQQAELMARQGGVPRAALEHAIDAIDRALRADPDNAAAYTTKAYVLSRWYRTAAVRGPDDQRPLLERIAAAAERAVELDRADARAWDALGNAHVDRGTYESYHGGDGDPWLGRALDDFGHALAIRPGDPWVHNDLGVAHRWIGTSLDQAGQDPLPEYFAALHSYERATALDPRYVFAWSNQVDLHASIAEHDAERGIEPRAAVAAARQAGERCLAVDPSYRSALTLMAKAQLSLAGYLVDTGGDPTPVLSGVRADLARARTSQPGEMALWFYALVAAVHEATFQVRHGDDPTSALEAGSTALAEVLRRAPTSSDAYVEAARLDLAHAAWAERRRLDPAAILARARANAERAVAHDPQFADAKLVAAEACWQLATHGEGREAIQRGLAFAEGALALNPRLRKARAVRDLLSQP